MRKFGLETLVNIEIKIYHYTTCEEVTAMS